MIKPGLCLLAFAAILQPATLIDLTIAVRNPQHKNVPRVAISVQDASQQEVKSCQTDADGSCRVSLPAGRYTVHADSKQDGATASIQMNLTQNAALEVNLEPAFFDEPQFTVAGVTDNTYRGGHGADTILRSSEDLTKAAGKLSSEKALQHDDKPLVMVLQLQHTAEKSPTEPNLFNWGIELLSHRAAEPACEVFARGVRMFPSSMRLLLGLGSAQYSGGRYQQAAQSFFSAADLNPADATPYEFLWMIQAADITQLSGYRERLKRFALANPQNALADYNYAVSLWNHDHSPNSIPLLKQAVTINSHLANAYLQLGIIASAYGRHTEAIGYYQQAVAEDASLSEAHYRLADAYRMTSNSAKASEELAEYRKYSRLNSEKREQERSRILKFVVKLKTQ